MKYILSCTAATVAETLTYPLDIVKTRLQIQGELKSLQKKKGMFRISLSIIKHEGASKLWAGVTPAVYRHLVYTGCRLVFYEQFRDSVKKNYNNVFPLWMAVLVGSFSGALAQFIASPTDLVKVKMQADRQRSNEGPRKGVSATFVQIYREGGIKSLWRGSVVNVQRAALVNLGDLATYDLVKHFVMKKFNLKDDYKTHTLGSICSGLIAATMGTPADVIKTRIMCQPVDSNGRGTVYTSSLHCLKATIHHEGFLGLYKGYWPTWLRMAPWSLTFWITYEQVRRISGMGGF